MASTSYRSMDFILSMARHEAEIYMQMLPGTALLAEPNVASKTKHWISGRKPPAP
jgi:hypothetical protein